MPRRPLPPPRHCRHQHSQATTLVQSQPLPRLELVPVGRKKRANRRRKFSAMLAFPLGMAGGPENEGMPGDVFRVVMAFVMPSWEPLRRGSDICLQLPD